jgi:hypothetical protein
MRIFLLCIVFTANLTVCAQRECVSYSYNEAIRTTDMLQAKTIGAAENFINTHTRPVNSNAVTEREMGAASGIVIRIPVVVHVLYNNASENISDDQIRSQIDALNRDFRRLNADTVNTPGRFRYIAADVAIEFALATADPYGAPTNGITRKYTNVTEWTSDDKIKFSSQGGTNAWDSKSYLNIWVGNMRRLLGYSSAPGAAADRDGIVLNISVAGTVNVSSPYQMGRTAVHEAGHWLGLKHIWGDTYCGDDYIDDTPPQGNFTPGCPSGFRSSCSNGAVGDMYMNYMDFTYDACTNLFTTGQRDRMRAGFADGGPRQSLTNSKGLNKPWSSVRQQEENENIILPGINLYPNPAATSITVDAAEWVGKNIRIINMNGIVVMNTKITSKTQVIPLTGLAPGNYLMVADTGNKPVSHTFVKL